MSATLERLRADAERDGIAKLVVGALIERSGAFLILHRAPGEDFAGLHEVPSGTVDAGEGLIEALAREVREETGLAVVRVLSYVSAFDYVSGSGKRTRQFNFAVEASEGAVVLNPAEHDQALWANPGTPLFAGLNLSQETRAAIVEAAGG